ncbi:hypothetical protein D3C77_719340 [compost metagenome]
MAPCPKMIRLRVRMLAPSTVMPMGICWYARPRKLLGPRQMPLPPITSMPSLTTWRARSVTWYLTMADTTEGFSPRSTAPAVMLRAASIM